MKRLKLYEKILLLLNSLAAFFLMLSYLLPYIPPSKFTFLSVLSLGVPFLIILNFLFALFWLLRLKKPVLISVLVLILGYSYINSFYKLSDSKQVEYEDDISIMNFNVRLFNVFNWSPSKTVREDIVELIKTEQPQILTIQEYTRGKPILLEGYFDYNARFTENTKGGQVIFSKYPIINSGSLEFPETSNNAIFVDVVIKKDTLRVYNVHLQSTGINTDVNSLKQESSESLLKRLGNTFKTQEVQADLILKHVANSPYKVIISGDFNNTAFSYVYKKIKGDLIDTFEEAGNGFGRTFDFKYFPLRIDFILVDETFSVNSYKSFTDKLSDHYPIMTRLRLH